MDRQIGPNTLMAVRAPNGKIYTTRNKNIKKLNELIDSIENGTYSGTKEQELMIRKLFID